MQAEERTDVADNGPKSAVELAMERLRRQDAEAGDGAPGGRPLTDDQKQAIAAARRDYEAKVAEAEILMRSKLAGTFDPEGRLVEIEANHRRDLGQFVVLARPEDRGDSGGRPAVTKAVVVERSCRPRSSTSCSSFPA